MDRIDIEDFKGLTRYQFIDNAFKKIEKKLEGLELEFFELNEEIVEKLEAIKSETMRDEEYLFTIIPIVCNIDMTVTLEEFIKMCKYPSIQFIGFIDTVMDFCKNLGNKLQAMNNLNSKVEKINFDNLARV